MWHRFHLADRKLALRPRLFAALIFCLFTSIVTPCIPSSIAYQLTLEWDRNPESNIIGYRLHRGSSSRNYSSTVNVGNQTRYTVNDLVEGQRYFFAVTAHNPYGESGYSNELEFTAPHAPQSQNALLNPGFESGTSNWLFYTNGQGSFDTVSPGYEGSKAARITVTETGTNTQLYRYGIQLEPNTDYELSFAAYCTTGHDVKVSVLKHASPYTDYGLNRSVADLKTGWQTHTMAFRTKGFTAPVNDARLMFWFSDTAAAGDRFFIDQVALIRKGSQPASSSQTSTNLLESATTTGVPDEANATVEILSDDFHSCGLDGAGWTFVNPLGDGSYALDGVGTGNARLLLSVPEGRSHDPWTTNPTARLTQPAEDLDCQIEVKFDSLPSQRYQMQGILAEQDLSNWVRFDFYHDGSQLRIFAAGTIGGVPTAHINKTISQEAAPLFMRVKREGDLWTQWYSSNGTSWMQSGSFMQALSLVALGPFAGNHGSNGDIPAHTAIIDYFFNTDSPIIPEDSGNLAPEALDTFVIGDGSIVVDPQQTSYCTGQIITLRAAPLPGWEFSGWSGDVTGTNNPVTLPMDGGKTVGAVFTRSSGDF